MLERFQHFFRRNREAADLREEMRLHLELRARQLEDRGIPAKEAHSMAQRQFGNAGRIEDQSRDAWERGSRALGLGSWERLAQDIRLSARSLRKAPGFTAVAVVTLALGLGMNTAVFTVVDAVMLRALPYPEASRLVSMWEQVMGHQPDEMSSHGASYANSGRYTVSLANLPDYCNAKSIRALAVFDMTPKNLTGEGTPERLAGETVSEPFFSVLGVQPLLGRDFLPEDDRFGANPVTIVTYGFWQRHLGADPQALGRTVNLDEVPYRVIGVLPAWFRSPGQLTSTDQIAFYVPVAASSKMLTRRGDHDWNVVGRLRPGVTVAAAQAELAIISAALAKRYPESNQNISAVIAPLRDDLVSEVRESLWVLLGATALIVLITCVNVANLLLVRATARRHETSVRFALGASRLRIARQFLAESLLLALAGCAAGILLGRVLMGVLLVLAPASIPLIGTVSMDWSVFAVAAAVATITGVAFGVAPAWQAVQTKASEALKAASRHTGGRSQVRWRAILTATEVALSLVLLVGAGLLLKSFVLLMGVDLGFQPDRVLAMNINLPKLRYPAAEGRLQFFEQLELRVRALPGVQAAAYANRFPLRGSWGGDVETDLAPQDESDVDLQAVSPGYFETLGIPLMRGRGLTPADRNGAPLVALVNEAFVQRFFPRTDPLGHRIHHGADTPWMTVVGVVNDIRRKGKEAQITAQVYLPAAQTGYPVSLADFAVRSAGDPRQLVKAVQAQVLALDKDQPVTNVRTLEEIVSASAAQRRFQTVLLATFAAVALGLAVIGIFGVLSYLVSQRTGELGIRLALGARPRAILALVLRQAGALIGAGVALGLAAAFALTRYLESLLFGVRPTDWLSYGAAVALLAAVSLLAALLPARRGSRLDPMVALREE